MQKEAILAIPSNSFDLLKCIGAFAYHGKSRKHFSEMKVHEWSTARWIHEIKAKKPEAKSSGQHVPPYVIYER